MSCCGKRTQPKPSVPSAQGATTAPARAAGAPGQERVTRDPATPAIMRPAKGETASFVLSMPDGSRQSFGSRLEADSARVRQGGLGAVRQLD